MTEPMKTYHEIKKNLSNKNFSEIGVKSVVELEEKAAQIYAAQQVAAELERIKMYMKGRLDKCESEIKDTSVDSDARRLLQGHKYELSHLLKEIDSL